MRFHVRSGVLVLLIFSFHVAVRAQNPNASVSFEVYPVIQSDVSPRLFLRASARFVAGAGSETSGLNRWGDYSAMRVDPSDDKTFYFTTGYLLSDGTFNWSTAISKIQFFGCN